MRIRITEKKERSLGTKLFIKGDRCNSPKCVMVRRPSRPGIHGASRRKGLTDYGTQLHEKQKIQITYGLNNTQMGKLFEKYSADDITIVLAERLDAMVYAIGFAKSIGIARQMVGHGHILVNGRKVTIPSFRVKKDDVISIRPESRGMKIFEDLAARFKQSDAPEWFKRNQETFATTYVKKMTKEEIQFPFNIDLVGQFYSR